MTSRRRRNGVPLSSSVAAFLILAGGCGDAATKASLVGVATIAPGASCQHGGVTLTAGVDSNADGVLDPGEVTTTQQVCNGPQVDPNVLVATSVLAVGSSVCVYGGTQIDSGLDNGDGGGSVGNDVLEAGEIDSTTSICNGQSIGSFDLARPAGAVGTAHIDVSGASRTNTAMGITGASGAGGSVILGDGNTPASYALFDTGAADVAHTVPVFTPSLGTDGETFASNAAITEIGASPVENKVYIDLATTPPRLVRYHAGPTPRYVAITGLRVNAGVTLTIAQTNATAVSFVVDGDIDVQGKLTTQLIAASNTRPSLTIAGRNVLIGPMGSIDVSDAAGGAVGAAGNLVVSAAGRLRNQGTLTSAGAFHVTAGSAGGTISLSATALYNEGPIDSSGGFSPLAGVVGGNVTLVGIHSLVNDGTITATGGTGTSGGKGGSVLLSLTNPTHALDSATLYSTGAIVANGGGCANNGQSGGQGGVITISATYARIRHSAALTAIGGAPRPGSIIVPAGDCAGGAGGAIMISAHTFDAAWDATSLVDVSGALSAAGTAGTRGGGAGGTITVDVVRPQGAYARLLGYASVDANGGGFGDAGAAGGSFVHGTQIQATMGGVFATFIPEQLHVYPPLHLAGGAGGAGSVGGAGGSVSIVHAVDGSPTNAGSSTQTALLMAGAIDLQAGSGPNGFGPGGHLGADLYGDVSLTAPIDADGLTPAIAVNTTGELDVAGDLSLNGVSTGSLGGGTNAGSLALTGSHVTLSGNVNARGGNASMSRAGDGGAVLVFSTRAASTITGTISVLAGTGAAGTATNFDGFLGTVVVDGLGI